MHKIFALVLSLLPPALSAQTPDAPRFAFPADCEPGETCFLQQFMDRDPGPGFRAFDCGPQSYDGHTGTDIRVADLEAMANGVTVMAAASGTVRALRDGVPDGGTAVAPDGQDCGNGVVLQHADGWETQYCHLKSGSIVVREGDTVAVGATLGQIGYSGRTAFPHLEFLVRHNGQPLDPFDPSDLDQCGTGAPDLWAEPLSNPGGGILSVGFSDRVPNFADILNGDAHVARIGGTDAPLVVWGFVHGGRAGDILRLRIADAQGDVVFAQDVTLERTQAQLFRAAGRRAPATQWPPGLYRGEVILRRGGDVLDRREVATTIAGD